MLSSWANAGKDGLISIIEVSHEAIERPKCQCGEMFTGALDQWPLVFLAIALNLITQYLTGQLHVNIALCV